jgi:hypothetical protein
VLGRFLEIALVTDDPQAGWELYQRLGFAPAVTGDIWSHAYGVVACDGLALGLHARGKEPLALCTMRPNVRALHRELEALGIGVEMAQLGPDQFNQLTLRDPTGVALRVLEARSFAPPADAPQRTMLGRFVALSLPGQDLAAVADFWSRLGLATREASMPWGGIEIDGDLPVAYHEARDCSGPVLVFRQGAPAPALEQLLATGLERGRTLPALAGTDHLLLRPPEGIDLLVLARPAV